MGQGAIDYIGVKGGLDINGIIESYYVYAGENISAGSFVEFISGVASQTTNSYSNSATSFNSSNTSYIAVTALSSSKVLIAYRGSSGYGYLKVASISNGTVTLGTDVAFNSVNTTYIDVTYLSSSKAIVSYVSANSAYAIACTISNDTITLGTAVKVDGGTTSYPCDYTTITYKSSSYAVMCWDRNASSSSTTFGLKAVVLTISGTTITVNTIVAPGTYEMSYLNVEKISSNKYIVCGSNYDGFGYAYIITLSGTTPSFSKYASYDAVGNNTTKYNSVSVYSTSYAVVAYLDKGSNIGNATVIDISGSNPVCGSEYTFYTDSDTDIDIFDVCITDYFIFYATGYSTLQGCTYTISGTTLSFGTKVGLASGCNLIDAVTYNGTRTFLAYSSSAVGTTRLVQLTNSKPSTTITITTTVRETQVRNATSMPCNGVATTNGIGGTSTAHNEQVKIYIPDI